MPSSLEASLDALEADNAFLCEGDVFTPGLIEAYVRYKREEEVDAIRMRPHPWEFALYHDALSRCLGVVVPVRPPLDAFLGRSVWRSSASAGERHRRPPLRRRRRRDSHGCGRTAPRLGEADRAAARAKLANARRRLPGMAT